MQADDSGVKCAIPCLEPCALMLKFARGVFRFEQHNGVAPGQRPVVATAPKPKSLMNHREGPAVPWAVSVRTGGYPHPAWAEDGCVTRATHAVRSDTCAHEAGAQVCVGA